MVCKWFDVCPLRHFEKKNLIDNHFRLEFCESEDNWRTCARFIAEKKGREHPDNLLPDGHVNKSL